MFQITEDYRVVTDSLNYTIQERKVNQDKKSKNYQKEYWVNIPACYCGSLTKACIRILEYAIMTDKEKRDIKTLMDYMRYSTDRIIEGVKTLQGDDE